MSDKLIEDLRHCAKSGASTNRVEDVCTRSYRRIKELEAEVQRLRKVESAAIENQKVTESYKRAYLALTDKYESTPELALGTVFRYFDINAKIGSTYPSVPALVFTAHNEIFAEGEFFNFASFMTAEDIETDGQG